MDKEYENKQIFTEMTTIYRYRGNRYNKYGEALGAKKCDCVSEIGSWLATVDYRNLSAEELAGKIWDDREWFVQLIG